MGQHPRTVIDRVFRDRTAVARSDGSVHTLFPVAIGAAEGESLRGWVERERATRTVEVGLGYGISTLFVCAGLLANGDSRARHVAIDPHQETEFASLGRQLLEEAGVGGLVEFYPDESQIALPRLLGEERRFDLAFVDDLQLPSVARAVSFCTTNLEWEIEEDASADDLHHWVVLRTARDPAPRRFDHYVEF